MTRKQSSSLWRTIAFCATRVLKCGTCDGCISYDTQIRGKNFLLLCVQRVLREYALVKLRAFLVAVRSGILFDFSTLEPIDVLTSIIKYKSIISSCGLNVRWPLQPRLRLCNVWFATRPKVRGTTNRSAAGEKAADSFCVKANNLIISAAARFAPKILRDD